VTQTRVPKAIGGFHAAALDLAYRQSEFSFEKLVARDLPAPSFVFRFEENRYSDIVRHEIASPEHPAIMARIVFDLLTKAIQIIGLFE
jgi:hypothetical protein